MFLTPLYRYSVVELKMTGGISKIKTKIRNMKQLQGNKTLLGQKRLGLHNLMERKKLDNVLYFMYHSAKRVALMKSYQEFANFSLGRN